MDLTICFVYQAGKIAAKATTLLQSIRKFHKDCHIYLGVPLPCNIYGKVNQTQLSELVDRYDVKVMYFTNSIDHNYKIGNKVQLLYEMDKLCPTNNLLFLDSDIIQLSPFELTSEFLSSDISFKTSDMSIPIFPQYLIDKYYLHFAKTYQSTFQKKPIIGPYPNAGFIFVSKSGRKKGFPSVWLTTIKELIADPKVARHTKFPWADQVSAPCVVKKLNLSVNILTEVHNYPLHLRKQINHKVIFCHYHNPENLKLIKHCMPSHD